MATAVLLTFAKDGRESISGAHLREFRDGVPRELVRGRVSQAQNAEVRKAPGVAEQGWTCDPLKERVPVGGGTSNARKACRVG
jgi:hypothetical protein